MSRVILDIESQFDSQYRVNLNRVLHDIEIKTDYQYRVNLSRVLLDIESKTDSQYRVILNRVLLDNESKTDSQYRVNLTDPQLLGIPGRILVPPVTQLFRSKWLNFSFSDAPHMQANTSETKWTQMVVRWDFFFHIFGRTRLDSQKMNNISRRQFLKRLPWILNVSGSFLFLN